MKMDVSLREELQAAAPGRVRFQEPMRFHTTFHIGGPAEVWAEPQDAAQLRKLLQIARDGGLPVAAVGGGANLLVRDEGIPGLVIHPAGPGFQRFESTEEGLLAGAALPLEGLVRRAQQAGLAGVEFLAGVPGQVGGAVRMNAGTHDDEGKLHHFGDVIRSIGVMEPDGKLRTLSAEEAGFGYRSTRLNGSIVLETLLQLSPDDRTAIAGRVQRLWDFKKRTQDWSAPSVGCIFKNPAARAADEKTPEASWMMDQAGMKGRRLGGAMISPRHANFIVNVGNAKAADVFALIEEGKAQVRRRFGVELELEVRVLP